MANTIKPFIQNNRITTRNMRFLRQKTLTRFVLQDENSLFRPDDLRMKILVNILVNINKFESLKS